MKRKRTKLFSLLLAAALVLGSFGMMAFATEADYDFNESMNIQGDAADNDSFIEPAGDDILTETGYGSESGSSELTEGSVADNAETAEDITEYDADFDENAAEDVAGESFEDIIENAAEDITVYSAENANDEEDGVNSEDIEEEDADDEEDLDEDYDISTLASKSTSTSNTYMAYPSTSGRLQVIGTQLCDQNGNPVQLKGVSSHGLSWYPEYVNSSCLADLRSWGANVFRLAMYTADYNGYCTGGNQTTLKNLIKQGVDAAKANDMYVIIDWHILSDSNPLTYQSQAKTFFNEMSKEFAGYNNVIYEICNEPNSGTSWSDIKSYANTIIPVIRANDPNAVIIVGTPTWSQDVDVAAADPLTGYSNIMYAMHFYAATHGDYYRDKMTSAINAGLPVFVSEYGICDSSGSGSIDESSANTWVSLMNQYGVSYVMWNMSNKDESSAILKSSVTKTSGFSYDDLSQSGRWLLSMLGGSVTGTSDSDTDIVQMNGKWVYTVNGEPDYTYTGVAQNSNGWWYVANGVVDFSYNGFAHNSNGWWYCENGKVKFDKNSVIQDTKKKIDGTNGWWYVVGGKAQFGYTGVANYSNSAGWWYIKDGKVDFSANTVAQNDYGWWYVVGGKVQFGYTGVANYSNSAGWWYIKNGKVDFSANTVAQNNYGWWYVVGGKVQFEYTGVANYSNSAGWWYIKNGKVDFSANTVAQNNYGWWYVLGGKVQFGFTGLADYSNSNGWWYIKNGKVDFTHNGVDKNKNGWWYVLDGKVQFGFTGLADYSNSNGWWYIKNGKVDFTHNGVEKNKNGLWYVKDGKVDFSFTGTVTINGKQYNVTKGKV